MKIFKTRNMIRHPLYSIIILIISLSSCAPDLPTEVAKEYKNLPEKLDFNIHVKPILSDKCFLCHGPDKESLKAGLQLHLAESAYGELAQNPGKFAIKPGNISKSEITHRILSEDPERMMPTPASNLKLSAYEKAIIIK